MITDDVMCNEILHKRRQLLFNASDESAEFFLTNDVKAFETPSTHLMEHAPKIARLMGQGSANMHEDENEYEYIELDFLGLVCDFLENLNTPNQQINVAIPRLDKYLNNHLEVASTVHVKRSSKLSEEYYCKRSG
jgi:hypothetical protein